MTGMFRMKKENLPSARTRRGSMAHAIVRDGLSVQ
jgi:hypothetical protein